MSQRNSNAVSACFQTCYALTLTKRWIQLVDSSEVKIVKHRRRLVRRLCVAVKMGPTTVCMVHLMLIVHATSTVDAACML